MTCGLRIGLLAVLVGCNGSDKDSDGSTIVPIDSDADTDTDTDSDADADTDADTDVPERCAPLEVPGDAIAVADSEDLTAAVAAAPDGATLALADGVWTLTDPIVLDHPITLMSASQDPAAVIIDANYVASNVFTVTSSDVTLAALTLMHSYDDLVAVTPTGGSADHVALYDLALIDPGHKGVTATSDWLGGNYADAGSLACSTITLTSIGQDEIRGSCETGGVDLAGVEDWVVSDNALSGFWCDFGLSGPGIRAWRGSRGTLITRNVLIDVAYGIVLGETQDAIGRVYPDEPCDTPNVLQSVEGVVTNNIVSAGDDDLVASDGSVLTGIRAESSCDLMIAHNSVFAAAVPTSSAMELRFETTVGLVANNLLSDKLVSNDLANADMLGNLELVQFDTWYWPAGDDFHTSPGATWVIDLGDPVTNGLVTEDIDGEPRDDGLPDVGADEI